MQLLFVLTCHRRPPFDPKCSISCEAKPRAAHLRDVVHGIRAGKDKRLRMSTEHSSDAMRCSTSMVVSLDKRHVFGIGLAKSMVIVPSLTSVGLPMSCVGCVSVS